MNRIVIFEDEIETQSDVKLAKISCSLRAEHIQKILKLGEGDQLKVTIANVGLCEAKILTIDKNCAVFELESETKVGREADIHLTVGLSRPMTCKKVIEHGTSLGVRSFHFFTSELSEKSYAKSNLFLNKEYEKLIHLGLSQSNGLYQLPEVNVSNHISGLRDQGPKMKQKFILSPFAKKSFKDFSIDFSQPIELAIGSERGWTAKELQNFNEMGYEEVKISEHILRVEIATYSALGQLELLKFPKL
ncbi:RsmE family RNA methyltransferase [Halobacteriovorax sp. GB3]|uniref:RsmE family RNA methyltransferase n=1 Tax=Halobacteriovorax sp. GB3 TaxID=2719615 RepID=UPI00235DC4B4|nr:RsmE family RNA methyltransferase [Halobacteriovorax sp. GB3]MDD0852627.1 RsmE family RNA methyltransferase [Halobacteriovorax sp. GB3]